MSGDRNEVWKDVAEFEGYQISDAGRVRSLDRTRTVRDAYGGYMTRSDKGRLLSPCDNGHGYLYVPLRRNGKVRHRYVHRLVAEAFCDNPEGKPHVNHKDHDRGNNAADNLEWVTAKENVCYSAPRMRHPKKNAPIGKTGERYISIQKDGAYRVDIKQLGICKRFASMEAAVEYRNEVVQAW